MMKRHGLPVEMTAEEFETGHWQRSILEADRQAQEEREGRRLFMESCEEDNDEDEDEKPEALQVVSVPLTTKANGRRRSASVASLSAIRPKANKMARLTMTDEVEEEEESNAMPSKHTEPEYIKPVWFERRIPNNGGEVCARLVEEFMDQLTQ